MDSEISVSIIFSGILRTSIGISDIYNAMVLAREVSHLSQTCPTVSEYRRGFSWNVRGSRATFASAKRAPVFDGSDRERLTVEPATAAATAKPRPRPRQRRNSHRLAREAATKYERFRN